MKKYIGTIATFPFSVKWFLITEMIFGLSFGIWNVNLNFHLKSIGFSDIQLGTVLAFGGILTAVFALTAGELCDRIGFHPAMIFGCLLKGSGMVIIAISPGFTSVLLGQLIISIGDSLVLSSEFPYLLGLVEEKHRNTVYSLLISFFLFAMFAGNIFGGYITSLFYVPSKPYVLSIFLSGLLFVSLGISRMFLPKTRVSSEPRKLFIHLLKESKIILFIVYGILSGCMFNLLSSMSNIIFREQFKLSDSEVGIVFSLTTLAACFSAFIVPMIIVKFKNTKTAIIVQVFNIIAIALMIFSPFKIFMLLWIVSSFFRTMLPGMVDSSMLQSISQEQQGAYSGMRIFANNIGMGVGAYAAGIIMMYSNYSFIMLVAACVSLLQLIVYSFGCKQYIV